MSANAGLTPPKLPALRLTPQGPVVLEEAVPLDMSSSNTGFSVSVAPTGRNAARMQSLSTTSTQPEQVMQGTESLDTFAAAAGRPEDVSLLSTRSEIPPPVPSLPTPPPFQRSATVPLPSQLDQLRNPYNSRPRKRDQPSPPVKEMSYELADSIQMIVQTLLQISPAQILDPTKEHYTACSLSVPTSSMSAMFTVMKNINYLSANMASYCGEEPPMSSRRAEKMPEGRKDRLEFDVGETLQAVGDSLSGSAASVGVDLVLYHGDVSLKHVSVYGDEPSIRYATTQVIQQVLNTAERGDTVELGLLLTPISPQHTRERDPKPSNEGEHPNSPTAAPVTDIFLRCTIRISHKFAVPERGEDDPYGPEPEQTRASPNLSLTSLRQILKATSSTLRTDLPAPSSFPTGRTIELEFPLVRARSSYLPPEQVSHFDPNLPHLIAFAETLKGKKVTLYASAKGCFAQHLTSYLSAWGMVVSHVRADGSVDGVTDRASPETLGGTIPSGGAAMLALAGKVEPSQLSTVVAEMGGQPPSPSFVFIDDDIEVLKDRLLAIRREFSPSYMHPFRRPPLANLHRPRSTSQVPFAARSPSPVVILHFTSLSNYKHLKETVNSIISTFVGTSIPIPEVMIIPKPAGPRRFLTALYTAVTKPTVDSQFTPIATSPMSPNVSTHSPFFNTPPSTSGTPSAQPTSDPLKASSPSQVTSTSKPTRPPSSRANSNSSVKPAAQPVESPPPPPAPPPPIPPSPLSIPNNIEYFSEKLGTTPSSGFLIQSPDGQPTGILFRPNLKSKNNSKATSPVAATPADGGANVTPPAPSRRTSLSSSRVVSTTMLDFGALHKATTSTPATSVPQPPVAPPTASTGPPTSTPSSENPVVITATAAATSSSSPSAQAPLPPLLPKPTTRKPSLGPKPTPPGSPQIEPPILKKTTTRKTTQPEPVHLPTSSSKKSKLGEATVVPPISVLIVDDNPINQTILSTFMRKKKIKYDIANNGLEAVEKWASGGYHLILMDIQMPVMDGIEATRKIRALEREKQIAGFPQLTPVIEGQKTPSDGSDGRSAVSPYRSSVIIVALTASSLQADRVACLAAGCNDFLTKPVSLLWLNNKIIEWGSIKALQMWADLRPDAVGSMNSGQAAQARSVADNLRMPPPRKKTPSPKRAASLKEGQEAVLALASPPEGKMPESVQRALETAERNGTLSRSNSRILTHGRRVSRSPEAIVPQPSPKDANIGTGPPATRVDHLNNGHPRETKFSNPLQETIAPGMSAGNGNPKQPETENRHHRDSPIEPDTTTKQTDTTEPLSVPAVPAEPPQNTTGSDMQQ